MPTKSVINVDLADVYASPNRSGFLHTMAWGDYVDVEEVTSKHVKITTVKFETKPDGSILPVKTEAFITPTKSSKLKPADLAHSEKTEPCPESELR